MRAGTEVKATTERPTVALRLSELESGYVWILSHELRTGASTRAHGRRFDLR